MSYSVEGIFYLYHRFSCVCEMKFGCGRFAYYVLLWPAMDITTTVFLKLQKNQMNKWMVVIRRVMEIHRDLSSSVVETGIFVMKYMLVYHILYSSHFSFIF